MPTNDERRKIAAELRENRDPLTPYNLVEYIFEDPWNHDSGEEVAARLADLIEPDERTCHDDYDGRQFRCSECGAFIHLLKRDDAFDWEFVYPDFCPRSCDAWASRRVVTPCSCWRIWWMQGCGRAMTCLLTRSASSSVLGAVAISMCWTLSPIRPFGWAVRR